jgi:hypothetical protein
MDGVRYVAGDADGRGPTGVYSWVTSRGARITLSLPRDKAPTEQLRQFVEEEAHRTQDESDETVGGFNFAVSFTGHDNH